MADVTDIVDQQTRSRMMPGIRGKNTKPELALRRALHAHGFRFRLHSGKVHGRPDLVLPKHRALVFVRGCFWHRHEGCRYTIIPATRSEFWQSKFQANMARGRCPYNTSGRRMARSDSVGVRPAEACTGKRHDGASRVAAARGARQHRDR
jgi:DNA mismatch endonuclease Vsr